MSDTILVVNPDDQAAVDAAQTLLETSTGDNIIYHGSRPFLGPHDHVLVFNGASSPAEIKSMEKTAASVGQVTTGE